MMTLHNITTFLTKAGITSMVLGEVLRIGDPSRRFGDRNNGNHGQYPGQMRMGHLSQHHEDQYTRIPTPRWAFHVRTTLQSLS